MFQRILKTASEIQARKLFDYNIVLIGFMGAGKTTVSDYLSTMFDMDIIEMDQEITDREEMSIPDIFATYGKRVHFRIWRPVFWWSCRTVKCDHFLRRRGTALRENNG